MPDIEVIRGIDGIKDALAAFRVDPYAHECTPERLTALDAACRYYLDMRNTASASHVLSPGPLGYSGSRNEADEFINPPHEESQHV